MKATLIEIDQGLAPGRWYSEMGGRRFWCRPAQTEVGWALLDGQGTPGRPKGYQRVISPEHAWRIREGEVELRLVEVAGEEDAPMADLLPILAAYLALILAPFAILGMAILVFYMRAMARCVRDRCWRWQ